MGQNVCKLVLLDLSAAFDTVDHEILLCRLRNQFGINGIALDWYKSYLSDRFQQVSINGTLSKPQMLKYGVPQGSILGPQKFSKYTVPLGKIIRRHQLGYHFYADDTQLYIIFEATNQAESIKRIECCVTEIRDWMKANYLKFNDDKTELVLLGTPQQLAKLQSTTVHIGDSNIQPSDSARNIGAIFDRHLTMDKHINVVCRVANFHLRNIRNIRSLLTTDACKTLVHSLVTSRLDYANSLLAGISKNQLRKLQQVQNNAARLIAQLRKFDHVSPTLKQLHWLPIEQRIQFKVLLITYKALNGMTPAYVREMLNYYEPPRLLRSSKKLLLDEPKGNLKTYGDRAYSVIAPKWWNKLPINIRLCDSVDTFKQQLKTHLMKTC
jgi:hypothetical protein